MADGQVADARAARAAAEVRNCRPPNCTLLARNIVLVFGGLATLLTHVYVYERVKDNFIVMQSAAHVKPCAIATPSARGLLYALNQYSYSRLAIPPTEEAASSKIQRNLCNGANLYQALTNVFENSSISHEADNATTFTTAEAAVEEELCRDEINVESQYFGDLAGRIATAYVLSNPAFRRIHTTGCMGNNHPFPSISTTFTCASSDTVAAVQLGLAASEAALEGFGVLPTTGEMLYRLLALSTIAEFDRRQNNNACFSNSRQHNATELCHEIYGSAFPGVNSPPPPAAPRQRGAETIPGYEALIETYRSCNAIHAAQNVFGAASTASPPPPPAPNWNFAHPLTLDGVNMGSISPEIDACRNVHTFGAFDLRSAFGVPDIIHEFRWEPSTWAWPAHFFHHYLVNGKMQSTGIFEDNPINALKLHSAYRFAVAAFIMSVSGACIGYYLGIGGVPLIAFVLIRGLRTRNKVTGRYSTLLAPPITFTQILSILVAVYIWFYMALLDPWLPPSAPYYNEATCNNWARKPIGSVFTSSDTVSGPWEWLCQYLFLLLPVATGTHLILFRGYGLGVGVYGEQVAVVARIPPTVFYQVVLQLGVVLSFMLITIDTGNAWFTATMTSFPEVHFAALSSANALVEDAGAVVVSSVSSGLAVGVMHQRWAIAQLGYRSHLGWTAVVGFSIWFPFLIYTIEIAAGSGLLTSIRTVGYILVLICSALSSIFTGAAFFSLSTVPGGKNPILSAVTNTGTVVEKRVETVQAKERKQGTSGLFSRLRTRFRTTASVSPSLVENLPLLNLKGITPGP